MGVKNNNDKGKARLAAEASPEVLSAIEVARDEPPTRDSIEAVYTFDESD